MANYIHYFWLGIVIVWQRFYELARLRIAYCPWVCPSVCVPCLVRHLRLTRMYSPVLKTWVSGRQAPYKCTIVIVALCQTSCPLRTVHYKIISPILCYRHAGDAFSRCPVTIFNSLLTVILEVSSSPQDCQTGSNKIPKSFMVWTKCGCFLLKALTITTTGVF